MTRQGLEPGPSRTVIAMPTKQARLLSTITFWRGFLFWCAISSTTGFIPILATALKMSAIEAAAFVAAAALGRVISQPLVGLLAGTQRGQQFQLFSLAAVVIAACLLFIGSTARGLIGARVVEGIGVSAFVVSWRLLLNRWAGNPAFTQLNDSAIVSQNAGRLVGPVVGGALASCLGLHAVFTGSALMCVVCLGLAWFEPATPDGEQGGHTQPSWGSLYQDAQALRWLLFIHHIEFFCMGLWLAAWPVFAVRIHQFSLIEVGTSFTAAAAGGRALPIMRRFVENLPAERRLTASMLLLMMQPFAAISSLPLTLLLPCMITGGLGATLYFSTFHWVLAHRLPIARTAAFYGLLGATTFIAQALGQAAAAGLQSAGWTVLPIVLDMVLLGLIVAISFHLPVFVRSAGSHGGGFD